jgi:serine protease Do
MERIIIKHLNGARANQEESFALNQVTVLTIGRDPSCNLKFDPDSDDLVSRNHARIERDAADPGRFRLVDTSSTNGVFVNNAKITGGANVVHGDVVRLGPDGPEFLFKLDPPPADAVKATRVAELAPAGKPTREAPLAAAVAGAQDQAPRPVGRETVERMLTAQESTSKKRLVNWVAALIGVVVLVAGGLVWYQKQETAKLAVQQVEAEKKAAAEKAKRDADEQTKFDATRVVAEYGGSTVYIEASWKLVHPRSKKTVHFQYTEIESKDGNKAKVKVPLYIQLPDGTIEPMLTLNDQGGLNVVVGGSHTGSGFVVTDNGFILTNRHVAAAWLTDNAPYLKMPGILVKVDQQFKEVSRDTIKDPREVGRWVPAQSLQGGRNLDLKNLIGEIQYLDVTFAKSKTRTPARIVKISDEADVALIKIDTPKALKPVRLAPAEAHEELKPGEGVVVLGYPGLSPKVFVRTESQDPFVNTAIEMVVPDNTVSIGAIGRLIRGSQTPVGGTKFDYRSEFKDMYQLTINSTGAGNSGGPTFDAKGRVIGIYSAGSPEISFAAPIKYGLDLLDIKQVIR